MAASEQSHEPAPPAAAVADPAPTIPPAESGARAQLKRLAQWVPIRSLGRRHRQRIVDHLLALSPRDRYLRFGYPARDPQIEKYVTGLDFARDEVLGIFNRRLHLIALAHLAYGLPMPGEPQRTMAEFGVSVLAQSRSRGLGRRLFDAAALHARNRGIDTLFIHALSENAPMLAIARKAGAKVERDALFREAVRKQLPCPPPCESLKGRVQQRLVDAEHVGVAVQEELDDPLLGVLA